MSCKGSIKIRTAKHLAYLVQNITRKVTVAGGAAAGPGRVWVSWGRILNIY